MNPSDRRLAYLRLIRTPAVFTALSNIVAAHLLATRGQVQWLALCLLATASCAIYMAGMVLNDCFDLAEDSCERPRRPLPSGAIPVASAWKLGWLLLVSGVGLAGIVGGRQLFIAVLLAGAVVLYDGVLKDTLLGGPLMGGCRYLNWLLGLSVIPITQNTLLLGLPIFVYVFSLTLLSGVETSARSRLPLLLCASGMMLTAVLIAVFNRAGLLPHTWALLLVGGALLAVLSELAATYRDFSPPSIQGSVGMLVMGIIPLDALLLFTGGPWWGGLVILTLMLPGRLLGRSIYVT
jgi:4-hydroxybenzoate polyprenyltransferase